MEKIISPILYIVAGPPGIGKSTNAWNFIPDTVSVLNHDEIEANFKRIGVRNYEEQANQKMWSSIQENISLGIDFGIELNLGTDEQYGLLKRIHGFCTHYEIRVLLFFTDIYYLCFDRAEKRAKSGGHEVEPSAIEYMRENTIRLLRKNIDKFKHITLINVTLKSVPELVYSGYYPTHEHEFMQMPLPDWVLKNFPEIVP